MFVCRYAEGRPHLEAICRSAANKHPSRASTRGATAVTTKHGAGAKAAMAGAKGAGQDKRNVPGASPSLQPTTAACEMWSLPAGTRVVMVDDAGTLAQLKHALAGLAESGEQVREREEREREREREGGGPVSMSVTMRACEACVWRVSKRQRAQCMLLFLGGGGGCI